MKLEMTQEQTLITGMVRKFVREEIVPLELNLDPDADELDPADRDRLVEKTKAMGLYGLGIPAEYGGPDIDLMTSTLIAIEMSQHRAGLYAPCYGTFGGAGLAQLFEATDEQKEQYLFPTLRGEKRGFFGLSEPSGALTQHGQSKQKRSGMATTGSSTVVSYGSAAPTRQTTGWCSLARIKTRVATASPALLSIPTIPVFTCAVLFILFALHTMRPNYNLKTCVSLMQTYLVR